MQKKIKIKGPWKNVFSCLQKPLSPYATELNLEILKGFKRHCEQNCCNQKASVLFVYSLQ